MNLLAQAPLLLVLDRTTRRLLVAEECAPHGRRAAQPVLEPARQQAAAHAAQHLHSRAARDLQPPAEGQLLRDTAVQQRHPRARAQLRVDDPLNALELGKWPTV